MSATNYSRNRLKFVYPYMGHDRSKSEVFSVPNVPLVINDKLILQQGYNFQILSSSAAVVFSGNIFRGAGRGQPYVFTHDISDSSAGLATMGDLGNLSINTLTTASVVLDSTTDTTGAFSMLAVVIK